MEGNISQTEGKQCRIVTDNASVYLFCYTGTSKSTNYILGGGVE